MPVLFRPVSLEKPGTGADCHGRRALERPVKGCGYRSRATRLSVPEPLRDRHASARARPRRWVGREPARRVEVPAARRGVSESDFTRAKPSWPSPACEPPVRSEPAPGSFQGGRRCLCFRGGGTRSASRSKNSNGESSTTPLAPGRMDFRPRPGRQGLIPAGRSRHGRRASSGRNHQGESVRNGASPGRRSPRS